MLFSKFGTNSDNLQFANMEATPIIWGVIPARYDSSRFPGKALVDIRGKTMIRRVYEQAAQAERLARVLVATDDERIAAEVRRFGGTVEMTAATHQSGTERLAEVAERQATPTHFINIQGDEPYIHPQQIDRLAETLTQPDTQLATLVRRIDDPVRLVNPSVVKVVLSCSWEALYFSRATIPHCRDEAEASQWLTQQAYYQHLGLYGYTRSALLAYRHLAPTDLERTERLEQLRWLAHGWRMRVGLTERSARSIDTPQDLAWLLAELPTPDAPPQSS